MKIDSTIYRLWLLEMEMTLPNLKKIFTHSKTGVLVIGAAVLEFYAMHGWIPQLSRRTGDLDLSVGITVQAKEYEGLRELFKARGYFANARMYYRLNPPVTNTGSHGYVDLLAYPHNQNVSENLARSAMHIEGTFSLKGFQFAQIATLPAAPKVSFLNPLGLICLKAESYRDNPLERAKDFADIVELIIGLVAKGTHYEFEQIWSHLRDRDQAGELLQVLRYLKDDSSPLWDLDNIESQLRPRGLWSSDILSRVQRAAKEILEVLRKTA